MSEPMKNAAIEDVLSSIRRLVSEDTRKVESESAQAEEQKPPRLVLTPSLRVAAPEGKAQEPRVEAETAPDPMPDSRPEPEAQTEISGVNEGGIQDFVDEAFARIEAEGEPEDVASAPWSDPDKTTLFEAAKVEILTNPVHVPDPEADVSDAPDTLDALEVGAQEVEASIDDLTDLVEEDDTPLASRIMAMEAVIESSQDQWEPDGDVGDDYAGVQTETMEWREHIEEDEPTATTVERASEVVLEAEPDEDELEPEAASPVDDAILADDTFLDEESLRELVADIVRQELQGALGERITRNVRKLVRREIHRALAAHDLD